MAVDFENRIDDTIEFECRVDDNIEIDLSTVMAVKVPLPIALQDKNIEPTTSEQVVNADKGFSGLGTVKVGAVTSDIDENITARNIRGGVTILGVTGDLEPDKPDQSKVVEPSTSEQVITADSGYELASVTIRPVTAEIDSDIVAENIRKDTEILGVVGTMEAREDLDTELAEQETLIAELESGVNELPDKPYDMLQQVVDQTNSCKNLFYGYAGTNYDFIKGLDTSNVTNMEAMFFQNYKATSMDLKNFNTSKVTTMRSMFCGDTILESIDLSSFDTKNVTTMHQMFYQCNALTDLNLSNFDTSKVEQMSYMFCECRKITSIKKLDTSSLKTCNYMFCQCYNLVELPNEINTTNVTNLQSMFSQCSILTTVPRMNTQNATNFQNMFSTCRKLTDVHDINLLKATIASGMFNTCPELKNLTLKNIKINLQIGSGTSYGTLLTDESIINTFQELWDNTNNALGGTRTLTMSTPSKARTDEIYVKLIDITDEMRVEDEYIDNKKPCVVCESTDEGAMTLKEYGISKGWQIA